MKKCLLSLALVLSASVAKAGIMIEPYLAYEQGQVYAVGTSGDLSAKTSGVVPGLRLAYSLPILMWFGVDYSMLSSGTAKPDLAGSNYTISRSDLYAVVGVNLPVLLRAWLGYGLTNSATHKRASGDESYSGGTNMKVGVGLTMLPLVNVTVEAYKHDHSSKASWLTGAYADAGYLIGLSFPINL